MNIDKTLTERGEKYGEFMGVARVSQGIKDVIKSGENWGEMTCDKKEALDAIANKIARILNGDPEYIDNWHDIAGYARLIEAKLKPENPEATLDNRHSIMPDGLSDQSIERARNEQYQRWPKGEL